MQVHMRGMVRMWKDCDRWERAHTHSLKEVTVVTGSGIVSILILYAYCKLQIILDNNVVINLQCFKAMGCRELAKGRSFGSLPLFPLLLWCLNPTSFHSFPTTLSPLSGALVLESLILFQTSAIQCILGPGPPGCQSRKTKEEESHLLRLEIEPHGDTQVYE